MRKGNFFEALKFMTLITSTKDLKDLCERWNKEPFITVDTEFVRTRTFYSQLCLVQVGSSTEAVAIDVLARDLDFKPFMEVLKNQKVLKVFHAGRQDVEIFFQMDGVIPAPIFDTQIAAMVCGYGESAGYETLVKGITGHNLDKSQRFTDWSKRPLNKHQLEYAIGDVTYLREIYQRLSGQLERNNRSGWLEEEMKVLTSPETYQCLPENAWKRIKVRSSNRRFLARVQALAALREVEAQTKDVPRNRIYDEKTLLQLAAHAPKNQKELDNALSHYRHLRGSRLGPAILAAIKRADDLPDSELPKKSALRNHAKIPEGSIELLKVLLKHQCSDAGVAPKLVATVADLEDFARGNNKPPAFTRGWRHDLFGKYAEDLVKGRIALSVSPRGITISKAGK